MPLLTDLTTMTLLGARSPALTTAGVSAAVGYLAGTVSLMVIAALTPSLAAFALVLIGILAGAAIVLSSVVTMAAFWSVESSGYGPPPPPDATPGVVMLAVYLCAALSVVVYQYRRRRLRVAIMLALAGLAATVIVPSLWPWSFARGEEVRPGAWAANASVAYDPSWGTEVRDVSRFSRGEPRRHVTARLTLAGAPPQVTVQQVGVRSRFRLPDGTTVQSTQGGWFGSSFRIATVQAALGGVRLLQTREVFEEGWTPMLTLTESEFAQYTGRSGRLEGDAYFDLVQMREVGVLSVTRGAALDHNGPELRFLALAGGPAVATSRSAAGARGHYCRQSGRPWIAPSRCDIAAGRGADGRRRYHLDDGKPQHGDRDAAAVPPWRHAAALQ